MKAKWVKAIGRSNWDPPAYARICSIHFDRDYVNYENCRTRIKDDAIPVLNLPVSFQLKCLQKFTKIEFIPL